MGKNQSASGLTNVIQYSNGNITFVSGSTTLMSISSSGAITTTGVISGSNALSASYASNAELLDGLDSTVFTLTSSFNAFSSSILAQTASLNAFSASILATTASLNLFSSSVLTFTGSASTRLGTLESYTSSLNNKTASFATTGSNTFIGTQTISGSVLQSGSFTTTGTIIAQTINVQQVTSSVIYSSGSNIFGNAIANTQTFTGSVLITGSLTTSGSYSGTAICINGSFNLGSNACINYAGTYPYTINIANGAGVGDIVLNAGAGSSGYETKINLQGGTSGYAQFSVASVERMRITSCGYVGIGASPLVATAANLQVEQASGNMFALRRADCSNTGNSRILFQAYNASGIVQNTGIVEAGLDNSATNGYIGFYAGTAAMNMKITSGGCVGIGTSSPTKKLHIYSTDDTRGILIHNCSTTSYSELHFCASKEYRIGTGGSGADASAANNWYIYDNTAGCHRFTLTSTGLIGMNQPAPSYRLEICSPSSDCVLGLMSANGVNIDMVGFGTSLTYPQARVQMNDDGFYGGNLSFFTKPNGAAGNGLSERLRITSCGKVGIGASSPRWLLEICANNACGGGGQYPAVVVNNGCTTGYSALYFYNGLAQMGGMETSNLTCNILINSALGSLNLQTAGTNRLTLNNVGGFGTQLCNFCLTGTYQTLVTVENGSYGLMILSSCLGGGTYALYNVFNNAGTTTANLIHGNNIPVQISGNAVQVRSSNSATYCDMRSSYIRFY